ncbi:MAG: hypothetical protein LBI02_02965 [Opitutaceae bacterium]|jgi:hypothetical protein|nr:hypothetical protein [Opitutaceae bacterium]
MSTTTRFTLSILIAGLCLSSPSAPSPAPSPPTLRNDAYTLTLAPGGAVHVAVAGMAPRTLRPRFTILYSATDPKLVRIPGHPNYLVAPRVALRWKNPGEPLAPLNAWLSSPAFKTATGQTGHVREKNKTREWEFRNADGKTTIRVTGPRALETARPFTVGEATRLEAVRATLRDGLIHWEFPAHPGFTLKATLHLPPGQADPVLRHTLAPAKPGYYSVAFTGAPAEELAATLPIPQECSHRNHKLFDYVLAEPDLHLPRAQVATPEGNIALTPDPAECRFRLPSIADSRFGLMLENDSGHLRPVLLAPLLGGAESLLRPGATHTFTLRYVQRPGHWIDTHTRIARDIHGFRDQRDNTGAGPLNATIARVADFLTDRRGGNRALWDPQQKYYDYFTDKTGVFKPFSPLYGLSAAIITDDETLLHSRALPALEYALSRPYNVFAPYDNTDNKQANSAIRTLGAPYPGYAQLLALHELLQRRTPALADLARRRGPAKNNLADALARWRLTAAPADLAAARSLAPRLAGRTEEDLFNLLDLADTTAAPADLAAAREAAHANAALRLNLYPVPPPDALVTVDRGNRAPVHPHSIGRHARIWGYPAPVPVTAPQQTVPAWRIARLGLPSPAYPIEYWMNTHAATLRVAALTHDPHLRALARWGMVGRFGNYPGDNRSLDSLVPELPDAIESPPWRWNFATVNPGHAWDFIAALLDFLVTDAFDRSRGAIDFPALPAAGSGFRVRIYGGAPGKFYDASPVHLWLPRDLLATGNPQLDWLAARGDGHLYLALWNQSFDEQTATLAINPALAECDPAAQTRVWRDNRPAPPLRVTGNRLALTLSPKSILALAIPARTKPRLQARLYDPAVPPLGPRSFREMDTPFGTVRATLIRADRTTAYIYTTTLPENAISARLRWKQNDGPWREMTDDIYPYEFSPVLADDTTHLACMLEIETPGGQTAASPLILLTTGETTPPPVEPPPPKPFPPLPPAAPSHLSTQSNQSPPPPPLDDDFIAYIKRAANQDNYGLRADGRFYPYSTPQGRRIGWRQPVWDKTLFETGCTPAEAEKHLRATLARVQLDLTAHLRARHPPIDFARLDRRQRETLLDLASTGDALHPDLLETVLARDWERLTREHLYIRYAGHAPDHVWNKAFAARWNIK